MFSSGFVPASSFWPFMVIIAGVILVGLIVLVVLWLFAKRESRDLTNYIRKPFLFDSKAEFDLFKILVSLYGDSFYVFPQVHYVHLIQPRKSIPFRERLGLRSRIDRKSADFVLCDKDRVVPRLIIELDGPSHSFPERKKRDAFIDEITKNSGLQIVHLKVANTTRDFIKSEIDRKLTDFKKGELVEKGV